MTKLIYQLASVWPMIVRRSAANWNLLSPVVLGVLLASVVMSGTVIFFDSLREIALDQSLKRVSEEDIDVLLQANRGPTNVQEYRKIADRVEPVIEEFISPYGVSVAKAAKSSTFFLSKPGYEEGAGMDTQRAFVAYMPNLLENVVINDGSGMSDLIEEADSDGVPIYRAIVPSDAAENLDVSAGSVVSVIPYWKDSVPFIRLLIVGIFDRSSPQDPYWNVVDDVFMASYKAGTVSGSDFDTLPLYVSESDFMEKLGPSFTDMVTTYAWKIDIEAEKLNSSNASDAKDNIWSARSILESELSRFSLKTELDKTLSEYDIRLLFSKLQMFVVLIMIALVILYYVVTLSSLVMEQHKLEIAQLSSRGASRSQILSVFVLEGITIAVLTSLLAPLVAAGAVSILGYTSPFSNLTEGGLLPVRITPVAYFMSGLGGGLSFFALLIPAIQASKLSVSEERLHSNRPPNRSVVQKYYLDVGLLLVGLLLLRQLSEQGSLAARGLLGDVVVNQIMLAVPALILIGAAMVVLRLFPLCMGLISRLFASRLPVGIVLALWNMSRNSVNYARLVLLLMLMTGLGIFAASFGGTLDRSFQDRELYKVRTDITIPSVRINSVGLSRSVTAAYQISEGVEVVSPALRSPGLDLTGGVLGDSFSVLGIEPQSFADIAVYRSDYSTTDLPVLMSKIQHDTQLEGLVIPENARSLGLLVKSNISSETVALAARLRDDNGRFFTYELGTLDSGDWNLKEVQLFGGRRPWRQLYPAKPLSLMSISVLETSSTESLSAGTILIDSIQFRSSQYGEMQTLETFGDIENWHLLRNVPDADKDRMESSMVSSNGDGSLLFAWGSGNAMVGRGIYSGALSKPLPALASQSFLDQFGHSLNDEVVISVGGQRLTVLLADKFDYFPTLNTIEEGFLVLSLEPLITASNLGALLGGPNINEIWISLEDSVDDNGWMDIVESIDLNAPFPHGPILDAREVLTEASEDPLVRAGWRALLMIAFGSVFLLTTIGFISHSYLSYRERENQFALLRIIGLSRNQLMLVTWVEHMSIIGIGMLIGTWMGERLGIVMMPFLGSDEVGTELLPPLIINIDWSSLFGIYVSMGIVFSFVTLIVTLSARNVSLNKLLRLGEK